MKEQTLTSCINIRGAAAAIEFYKEVFGAIVESRKDSENGKVYHADLLIGTSRLMLCDEIPEDGVLSPESIGGCPFLLVAEVSDVEAVVEKALARGATKLAETTLHDGKRFGKILDPFGFRWGIATR